MRRIPDLFIYTLVCGQCVQVNSSIGLYTKLLQRYIGSCDYRDTLNVNSANVLSAFSRRARSLSTCSC